MKSKEAEYYAGIIREALKEVENRQNNKELRSIIIDLAKEAKEIDKEIRNEMKLRNTK